MKLFRFLTLFVVGLFLLFTNTTAQTNFGFRAISVNSHFGNDANQKLYHRDIMSENSLTLEPGILLSVENSFDSKTSIQFSTAMLWDQVDKISGFSQVMLKYEFYKSWKTSISAGFGPTVHYRQTRKSIPEYADEGIYTDNGKWQTQISWLSGEISLHYFLTKRTDFILSVNHTQARAVGIAVGFKIWLGSRPRKSNQKGCNCPSFR
jgi:hypothetical protein